MEKNVEKIAKLRKIVLLNPTRFKAMSRLSHLLMDYSKTLQDTDLKMQAKNEAFELAQRCVEIAPGVSIGKV